MSTPEGELIVDWGQAPVFGVLPGVKACVVRESAYGVIADEHGSSGSSTHGP